MALIKPGQQGTTVAKPTTGSTLIRPGITPQGDAERILAQRSKIDTLRADAKAADAEATGAENAASFLRVLGGVAKDIAQGTARSAGAAGIALASRSLSKGYTPKTDLDKAIYGDKEISFKAIGEDFSPLVEKLGVSPETAKRIAPFTGLMVGALDLAPIPGETSALKLLAKESLETIAKETSKEAIFKLIKTGGIKGGEAEIGALAEALVHVNDPKEVYKVIKAATTPPKNAVPVDITPLPKMEKLVVPSDLQTYAQSLVKDGYTKSEFLTRLGKAIDSVSDEVAMNAIQFKNELKEAGFTPGKFYDAVHGIPVPREGIPGKAGLRAVGLAEDTRQITRAETSLLRERIQAMAKNTSTGFRAGKAAARKEIFQLQKEVSDLISNNLPPSLRGALLATLRNANRPSKLEAALRTVEDHIIDYNVLKQQAKRLSTARGRIGFIRKVGQFNQTAVNDVKRALNISKPLRAMNELELKKVSDELSTRLQFKRDEGLIENLPKRSATSAPDSFYDSFSSSRQTLPSKVKEEGRGIVEGIQSFAEELGGIISTRLNNISPTLKYALRKFEYRSRQTALRDMRPAVSFAAKADKMDALDKVKLDIAMKNGFVDDVDALAKKYGFEEELKATRTMLDGIYARSKEVKLDVAYRKNYFPRSFKQDSATARAVLDYFERNDRLGTFDKAFREEATKFGRPLTDIEKMDIINTLLRGFQRGGVSLSKTGSLKNRIIEVVTPEINGFYQNSFQAMFNYIESVNNLIEARRFFGKHLDLKDIDPSADMQDVVGAYVNNLVSAGKIATDQQLELQRILAGRFSGKKMNPFLGALKDTGYLSVMSSPLNALTQLGDLGFAFYRSGAKDASLGLKDALGGARITKEDLGIADLQAEFSDRTLLSSGVDRVFKITGLNRIDRLGKETFINGTFRNLQSEVSSSPEKFVSRIRPIFGEEAEDVARDLAVGDVSENVKYLLFNELLDFQPIALSEVPLKYLEAPNGRVLYALKTYTLKLFDVYRREVIQTIKTDPKQGIKNLVRLSAYLMLFNATAQQTKNAITGRDINLPDASIDALASAAGFSRYQFGQVAQEGLGKAAGMQILPPTQLIDDVTKDAADIFKKGTELDASQLRTIQDLPVGGKLFYWWFGRGATQTAKATKKQIASDADIPSIEVPSIDIPRIDIPSISI